MLDSGALIAEVPRIPRVRLAPTRNHRVGRCGLVKRWTRAHKRLEAKLIDAVGNGGTVLAGGTVNDLAKRNV